MLRPRDPRLSPHDAGVQGRLECALWPSLKRPPCSLRNWCLAAILLWGVCNASCRAPGGVQWINLTSGGTVTPEGVALSHDSYANGLHMQATPGGRPMQCSAHNFVQSPDVAQPQARRPGRERTSYAWQSMYPQDSSQGLSPTFRDNTPVGAASRLGQHGLAAASHDSPCGGVSVASSRLFHSQPASATPLPQQPFRSHVNMATAPFLGNAAVLPTSPTTPSRLTRRLKRSTMNLIMVLLSTKGQWRAEPPVPKPIVLLIVKLLPLPPLSAQHRQRHWMQPMSPVPR